MPDQIPQPPMDYIVRRVRIHRKRTPFRRFQRFLVRFVVLLAITGGVIDLLHPRSIKPKDPSSPITLPDTLPPSTVHLTPVVTLRTAIRWTPVETLSLHHLPPIPADKPALFAASPVSRTFYPWESTAFFISIKHGTAMPSAVNLTKNQPIHIPRFSSFSIHTDGKQATLVEYADGLSTAAALYAACVATITVGDPSLPTYAVLSELRNFKDFLRASRTPGPNTGSKGWMTWPPGLGTLRQFADRKRRARAAVRVEKVTVTDSDTDTDVRDL